jgi:hypothetical protein
MRLNQPDLRIPCRKPATEAEPNRDPARRNRRAFCVLVNKENPPMQAEKKVISTNERDAIARTIQTYVDGGRSGKSADMKPAFHDGATIYGYIGAELFGGPIQSLFDWNDGNGPATELKSDIANIDIQGSIATARVELDNWTGHKFTDMFTLLKTDGEWKIISKVFYLHPEQ